MKLPNWLRIFWWAALLVGFSFGFVKRLPGILDGKTVLVDTPILIVWLVLLLLPLFSEIGILGFSFKKDIENLKTEIRHNIESVRTEIRNAVEVRTNISPNFVLAPPDSQLPAIEKRILALLSKLKEELSIPLEEVRDTKLQASPETISLFEARYNIERELRRLWLQNSHAITSRRFTPTIRVLQSLIEDGVLDDRIGDAVREVWTVASPAIHGEEVSAAKVKFVREVAPGLVAALKARR
ncbi:MAG TPA: hypothetical protein VJR23_08590 [Candidatus Acidoferrales bacterium]|nr:hypothetical protein [Candidatus Acidoferrales bacterium]